MERKNVRRLDALAGDSDPQSDRQDPRSQPDWQELTPRSDRQDPLRRPPEMGGAVHAPRLALSERIEPQRRIPRMNDQLPGLCGDGEIGGWDAETGSRACNALALLTVGPEPSMRNGPSSWSRAGARCDLREVEVRAGCQQRQEHGDRAPHVAHSQSPAAITQLGACFREGHHCRLRRSCPGLASIGGTADAEGVCHVRF